MPQCRIRSFCLSWKVGCRNPSWTPLPFPCRQVWLCLCSSLSLVSDRTGQVGLGPCAGTGKQTWLDDLRMARKRPVTRPIVDEIPMEEHLGWYAHPAKFPGCGSALAEEPS